LILLKVRNKIAAKAFMTTRRFSNLQNASEDLPTDKAVTREDARKVMKAETRGDPEHQIEKQGIAAQMQAAAQLNET
jgi:transposase-like protein